MIVQHTICTYFYVNFNTPMFSQSLYYHFRVFWIKYYSFVVLVGCNLHKDNWLVCISYFTLYMYLCKVRTEDEIDFTGITRMTTSIINTAFCSLTIDWRTKYLYIIKGICTEKSDLYTILRPRKSRFDKCTIISFVSCNKELQNYQNLIDYFSHFVPQSINK